MNRYETLVLAVPEITGDETKQIEKELVQAIEQSKGTLISFERWGKYRLAYLVNKNEYGVYFLVRFETDNTNLPKEVANICKVRLNAIVMRDMTVLLDPKATLVYQRPPSLEDAPTRDVRTFLRENKMEGLLSTVDTDDRMADGSDFVANSANQDVDEDDHDELGEE